jgi:hypothetical protein
MNGVVPMTRRPPALAPSSRSTTFRRSVVLIASLEHERMVSAGCEHCGEGLDVGDPPGEDEAVAPTLQGLDDVVGDLGVAWLVKGQQAVYLGERARCVHVHVAGTWKAVSWMCSSRCGPASASIAAAMVPRSSSVMVCRTGPSCHVTSGPSPSRRSGVAVRPRWGHSSTITCHLCGPIGLESAHRSEAAFELAVVGFYRVVRVVSRALSASVTPPRANLSTRPAVCHGCGRCRWS